MPLALAVLLAVDRGHAATSHRLLAPTVSVPQQFPLVSESLCSVDGNCGASSYPRSTTLTLKQTWQVPGAGWYVFVHEWRAPAGTIYAVLVDRRVSGPTTVTIQTTGPNFEERGAGAWTVSTSLVTPPDQTIHALDAHPFTITP